MEEEEEQVENTMRRSPTGGGNEQRDDKMKELLRLIDVEVRTEDLILEMKKYPAIWNNKTDEYLDRTEKHNAWTNLIESFIVDFDDRPPVEKITLLTILQKKWKNIRTSYSRELLRRKEESKSESKGKRRKGYLYFDLLTFLGTPKKTSNSVEEVEDEENEESLHEKVEQSLEEDQFEDFPVNRRQRYKKREKDSTDEELIKVLNKKIATETQLVDDEDKLFLLSLVSEMHKVPPENKLKLRCDIISVIAAAQEPCSNNYFG